MEATGTSTHERRFTHTQLIGAVAATALFVGGLVSGGFALAAPSSSPNTYYACVKDRSASLNSFQVNTPPTCGKKKPSFRGARTGRRAPRAARARRARVGRTAATATTA